MVDLKASDVVFSEDSSSRLDVKTIRDNEA